MSDAAYMDAVSRGDMATAQRMVDAAANASGYTIESFHGTNGDLFTVFDPSKGGEKTGADSAALGIFSTNNSRVAQQYAENYGVGGAMGLAFGSGPLAAARDEALETPEGKRLMRRLEDAKEGVKKAYEKVRKKAMDLVMEQAETVPSLKKILSEYGERAGKALLEKMAQISWSNEELYKDKIIVDAEKAQRDAEEKLSDYVAPFITERIPNKRIMQLRLKIKNPKIYDAGHKTPAQFSLSDKIQSALESGYDGVIFNNIIDPIESATHYVVFNSEQIKLANAVTKDDAGRIIPLSQRFNEQSKDIRNPLIKYALNYTDPAMRDRLKRKIMAGSRGGNPGEWSARKAQLLASEYEKAGGGYTGARSKAQKSLSKWTKQDWRTKSGKPSLETGERYLPAAAIAALTSAEYAATSRAKRSASGQFSRQPKRIAMKTKEFRNPATPEDMPGAFLMQRNSSQINTPAFKKWFAGSVVTTRDGEPRIMYHGTGWTGIRTFGSWRAGGIAGFFAFDPVFAEDFAMTYANEDENEVDEHGVIKRPSVYPVYLSLKKVFDVRKKEDRDKIEFDRYAEINGWVKSGTGWSWSQLENHLLVKRMKAAGFDGYIDFEKGSNLEPTGIAVFDPRNVKSAYGNRGTFDPMDPDITNPMDPRSAMTQITGTEDTYIKASKMLGGKVIDYGAGFGIGTDILRAKGLLADSFEPYPKKWKGKRPPTYTDSAKIPSASYDSLVSFSVINVVDPDERKFLFQEVDRILRPNGIALITGRDRQDVEKAATKIPHLEDGGYLIGKGSQQRYQKGFTQAELERYAKEVLGPEFTVERNKMLNGASIKITKGKTNPVTRSMIRSKLSRIIEPGDRILDYDRAQGEDLYRLWDLVHTDMPLNSEALTEIEGLLDDDGVLVIQSGEEPSGLRDHFRRATRYNGMLLVQGPLNPEEARINTEKLRRDLE